MKKLLPLLALLVCLSARGQTTNVNALVTFTNVASGFTNGQTITGNGDTRTATNNVTASPQTKIQATNNVGWAATNTWLQLSTYRITGVDRVYTTNTNQIIIQGALNTALTVTLSANVGTVSYQTNTYSTSRPLLAPNGGVATEAGRTNNASMLIELLNDTRQTNAVNNGVAALSNLVDRITQQTSSNKVFWLTTNRGGLSDGNRITNATSITGSNGALTAMTLTGMKLVNATNFTGTNVLATNVTLRFATLYEVNVSSGYLTNLTNGTIWSTFISNGVFNGTITAVTNGYWTNGVLANVAITNLIGSGTFWWGDHSVGSLTLGTNISNAGSIITGYDITDTIGGNQAYGNTILIYGGNEHSVLGNDITLSTNSVQNVAVGTGLTSSNRYNILIGRNITATNDFCILIGSYAQSTENNQVVFGSASNSIVLPGRIVMQTGITNFQTLVNSTNILRGDLSTPRGTYTGVSSAGAHNVIELNTNVWVDVTGSPSAAFPVGGISGGNRDGKLAVLRNITGYEGTIWSNDGSITAANRITTLTGTNMSWPSGSFFEAIYDPSSSRWLMKAIPMTTITATATNAMAFLDGSATNVNFYQSGSSVAVTVNPLIGSATNRWQILNSNSVPVAYMTSNNVFTASNYAVLGNAASNTFLRVTNANGRSDLYSPEFMMWPSRRRWGYVSANVATITQVGDAATLSSASAITPTLTNGSADSFATSASQNNAQGAYSTTAIWRYGTNHLRFATYVNLSSTNLVRLWVCLTDQTAATMANLANPAGNYFGVRYDSSNDVNFTSCTKDGTTLTATSTGVAADTSFHRFDFICDEITGKIDFYIDSVLKTSHTTTLPTANTNLRWVCYITTLEGVAKTLKWEFAYTEADR